MSAAVEITCLHFFPFFFFFHFFGFQIFIFIWYFTDINIIGFRAQLPFICHNPNKFFVSQNQKEKSFPVINFWGFLFFFVLWFDKVSMFVEETPNIQKYTQILYILMLFFCVIYSNKKYDYRNLIKCLTVLVGFGFLTIDKLMFDAFLFLS